MRTIAYSHSNTLASDCGNYTERTSHTKILSHQTFCAIQTTLFVYPTSGDVPAAATKFGTMDTPYPEIEHMPHRNCCMDMFIRILSYAALELIYICLVISQRFFFQELM